MKSKCSFAARPPVGSRLVLVALAAWATLGSVFAGMYLAPTNSPGGVPAQSTITSVTTVGTNTTVCWYGMQGWYGVELSTNSGTSWQQVGRTVASDHAACLTVDNGGNLAALFRLNQANGYAGSGGCAGCHGDKYGEWAGTAHADALNALQNIGQGSNPACVVCHTVGFGQPGGYTDLVSTPHLKDVGCETCHGPAAWHKYSDHDLVHPAVSLDPKICGGCHQGDHHPTYEEYSSTLHAVGDPHVVDGMLPAGPAGYDRQMSCGGCHSAATRMAMLSDYNARLKGYTNALALPSGQDAAKWTAACVTCHDPHSSDLAGQLRNPMRSTNYYTYNGVSDKRTVLTTNVMGGVTTNTVYYNTGFAAMYDPNVQVCAQCHNSRAARWDGRSYGISNGVFVLTTNVSFSRPPHHSPQYNVLIGIVQPDYLTVNAQGVATNWLQRHGTSVSSSSGNYNTNQCVACHVVSGTDPVSGHAETGHTFEMNTAGCTVSGCHSSVPAWEEEQEEFTNHIASVVSLLNQWALAKGTNVFGAANATKYKENGWEYTTPGALASITNSGPSSGDQLKLPDPIKQARFNLYMVLHDGSMGIHNPRLVGGLINDAEAKVLGQFQQGNFRAYTTVGYAPLTTGFTNTGVGATGYNWAFGDGNTSTLATPTNTYASSGVYDVTLTTTGAGSPETVTRREYIGVYTRPNLSFTADQRTGPAPLTVNFTNTSTSTSDVTAWRWTINGLNISTANANYTFTNAGSYNIVLRATTPVGNLTVTSNAFIVVTAP